MARILHSEPEAWPDRYGHRKCAKAVGEVKVKMKLLINLFINREDKQRTVTAPLHHWPLLEARDDPNDPKCQTRGLPYLEPMLRAMSTKVQISP